MQELFPNLDVPTPKAAVSQQAKRQKTATTRIPTLQTFESTQATESPSSSTTEVAASSLARTVPVTGLALVNNWSSPAKASWIILFLACAAAVVPLFGFSSWMVAGPLLLIVFILTIVVITRGGTGHGIVILLSTLIAPLLFIMIAPFISPFFGRGGVGAGLNYHAKESMHEVSVEAPDYFPMKVGMRWEYLVEQTMSSGVTHNGRAVTTIEGIEIINDNQYFKQIDTFYDMPGWNSGVTYRRKTKDAIYEIQGDDPHKQEYVCSVLPLEVGKTWTVQHNETKITGKVESLEIAEVLGKKYESCFKISAFRSGSGLKIEMYCWQAQDVGMLIQAIKLSDSVVTFTLGHFTRDVADISIDRTSKTVANGDIGLASVAQKELVTKSISNARQIMTGLRLYSSDHHGEYPSSLNELDSYLGKEGMNCDFHCPLLQDGSQIGYEYFGVGMTDSDSGDKIVLMSKKVLEGKRVVVHNDCRVEFEVPLPAFIPRTPSRPNLLNERLTSKKGRQVMEVLPFMLPFTTGDAARLLIGSWAELRPGQDSSLTIEYKADGTWNDEMQQGGKWMLHEDRLYIVDSASKILQYTILAIDTDSYVLCYNGRVPTDKREDQAKMTQEDRVSHVAERKK